MSNVYRRLRRERAGQAGLSLLEVLAAIIFTGIVSMAIQSSVVLALRTEKTTEVHFAASVLASDRMEQLLAIDAIDLDNSYDEVDTAVQWGDLNMDFLRTTTVTINADDSRTVEVNVVSGNNAFPVEVEFSSTMALWE